MKMKLIICFILSAYLLHECISSVAIDGGSAFNSSQHQDHLSRKNSKSFDLKPINPSECPTSEDTSRANESSLPNNQKRQQEQDDRDLPFQCMRRYFHEPSQEYDLQFIEDSIDEKAANTLYMTNIINPFPHEPSTYNFQDANLKRKTAGRKFDQQLCSEHLKAMLTILDELKHITQAKRQLANDTSLRLDESHFRLVRVLDSFGRYEPSLISGRHLFMGSYTQCHGTKMILDKHSPSNAPMVAARYCTAQLKIDNHLNEQLVRRKKFPHEMKLNIKVGICIPETCHTISFDEHKQSIQKLVDTSFQLPSEYFVEQHHEVESIFCGVDDDSEAAKIPFSGKLLICFLICWFGVMALSTYKENIRSGHDALFGQPSKLEPSNWFDRVYFSMSLQASWDNFISVSAETDYKRRVDLAVLSSTKVMAPVIVVLLHSFMIQLTMIADIPKTMFVLDTSPIFYLVNSVSYRIDCLFILSGLFIVYFAMKIFTRMYNIDHNSIPGGKNNSPLHDTTLFIKIWPQIFAARYLRLIPLYFLVVWFKKSLFSKLGSGPFWDYGLSNRTLIGACHQESWFAPLTYENAFKELSIQCEPQTWFLANEVFFNIYLTPIIVLTILRPKVAAIVGIMASIASFIAMIYGITVMPPRLLNSLQELRAYAISGHLLDYSYVYVAPYYHCIAFLVGIYCGYILHKFNEDPNKRWPNWMVGKFSHSCVALILLSLILPVFIPYHRDNFPKLYVFVLSGGRTMLVIATGLILVRATTCWQDTFFMKLSSAKCWQILSKLSFGIFLVHFDILLYERMTILSAEYYSGIHMFYVAGSHLFFSILVGLLFHLIFESPIDRLAKSFFFRARNGHKDIKPCIASNLLKVINPGESQL